MTMTEANLMSYWPILLVPFVMFYFMPMVFAYMREHPKLAALAIVNFFLGWTFVGWVGCLAWAFAQGKWGPKPGDPDYDPAKRHWWIAEVVHLPGHR